MDYYVATIAIVLFPERGAFNASFVLARRLGERGHDIIYIGPPAFAEYVSTNGFNYCTLRATEPSDDAPPDSTTSRNRIMHLRVRYEAALRWYQECLHDLERWAAANQPGLVLLDPIMWKLSPPFLRKR